MKEDFLQFIWKMQLFQPMQLRTIKGEDFTILKSGYENRNEGPDFLNASIVIDGQLWMGHVEIHLKSSDWYVHLHQLDPNYNATIAHVVWEYDVPVYTPGKVEIPTLELKKYVSESLLLQYKNLFERKKQWIYCENQIKSVEWFKFEKWLEALYFERMQLKLEGLSSSFKDTNSNWEEILFWSLARTFGLKINGNNFLELAQSISFSIFRKLRNDSFAMEALLHGQAGLLLDDMCNDTYYLMLREKYEFLKLKYKLKTPFKRHVQFFRLRPSGFPTIRLSQFANVYALNQSLFRSIIESESMDELRSIFCVEASEYWDNHYVFGKEVSHSKSKKVSNKFIDLILINTVLPIKFLYQRNNINFDVGRFLNFIEALPSEKNVVISKFKSLDISSRNAMHSQALIQLKTAYCDLGKCLQCAIGKEVLKNQS